MAEKRGSLPPYEELEEVRLQFGISVARFCRVLGLPASTWYYWRSAHLDGRQLRRWPAPVVDPLEERAAEYAYRFSAWGHRKLWAMMRASGTRASASSVRRALARRNLLLPPGYHGERRKLAQIRKETFLSPPTRRNRVWQVDFTEYETSVGGSWRICPVVDYATRTCLAAPVSGTSTSRDAVAAVRAAIQSAEITLARSLVDECVDVETGELTPLVLVTDNGPAFKSAQFAGFVAARDHLTHIRTRYRAPETNGVVERFICTLKYEHLFRLEITDAATLMDEVAFFVSFYNRTRPHQSLSFAQPLQKYLEDPHLFSGESLQES